jgi:Putative Actinobacterial Holin-X, holin superfamily III
MSTNAPEKRPDAGLPAEPEASVGQLVSSAMGDVSALIRSEIALAKAEVGYSIKNGGLGAALFAVAGFLLVLSVIMLSVAIAYFIHMTGLDLAWCFLIVWGGYTLLAMLIAFIGFRRVKLVRPPKRTIEQAVETKNALTSRG